MNQNKNMKALTDIAIKEKILWNRELFFQAVD